MDGGWTYAFECLEDVDRDYICIICELPMREPQLIPKCGHSFCKTCLEEVIRRYTEIPVDLNSSANMAPDFDLVGH